MDLLLFLLSCYGIWFLIVESSILVRPRSLVLKIPFVEKMFNCPFCSGFWTSLIPSFYYLNNIYDVGFHAIAAAAFIIIVEATIFKEEQF